MSTFPTDFQKVVDFLKLYDVNVMIDSVSCYIKTDDEQTICIHHNYNLEKNGLILDRSYDLIDYENGTHLLIFNPANFSISPGKYTLAVRSSAGTYYWTIRIIAKVSWGPIVVEISLVLCIVYLLIIRKKRPKS